MAKEVDFIMTFDSPWTGKVTFLNEGGEDPPVGNGNGDPPPDQPPFVDDYWWFKNGEELSILTGDQKFNSYLISSQAWYRDGMFVGHIRLDDSQPEGFDPLMVFPRGNHIPFKSGGLARARLAFGSGWYANKDGNDGMPVQVAWREVIGVGTGLQFLIPDPKRSGRMSRVKNNYPTDWGGYGLFLSWTVGVP